MAGTAAARCKGLSGGAALRRFLVFLCIAPAAVIFLAMPFLNHVPFVQLSELESEHTYFSTSVPLTVPTFTVCSWKRGLSY